MTTLFEIGPNLHINIDTCTSAEVHDNWITLYWVAVDPGAVEYWTEVSKGTANLIVEGRMLHVNDMQVMVTSGHPKFTKLTAWANLHML